MSSRSDSIYSAEICAFSIGFCPRASASSGTVSWFSCSITLTHPSGYIFASVNFDSSFWLAPPFEQTHSLVILALWFFETGLVVSFMSMWVILIFVHFCCLSDVRFQLAHIFNTVFLHEKGSLNLLLYWTYHITSVWFPVVGDNHLSSLIALVAFL